MSLKMVSGNNPLVASAVGKHVGLSPENILTGPEVRKMGDDALRQRVEEVGIFAEVGQNQKEREFLPSKRQAMGWDILGTVST